MNSQKKKKLIAVLCFVAVFIGLVVFLFYGENFNVLKEIFRADATKEEVQASIGKLGLRAYLVVFILSMLQVVMTFVPAEPLHVIAGISFGLWKGMAVCLAGIIAGNTIIYILYKIFGSKLTDYFQANVEFDFERAKKSNKIALIVIILYCLPAIPYGIICFFAATLGMSYPKYFLITAIGSIPSLIIDVGLGHMTMSTSWAVSIAVFVVIIILLLLMCKYKKQIFAAVNNYVKKSQDKAKNRVGNYSPFLTKTAGFFVLCGLKRKVKIKVKNNVGRLSKPCIVLCNHGSFFDFAYSGKIILKEKPHFIVARMWFMNKKLGWLINKTGAFPKSLLANDVENIKNCMKVIASKEVLAMMPEARLSTAGKFEGIQDATYKFIQKMGVPVYSVKIDGSYLANPKWGDKLRKGALVEVELNPLFSAEEIKSISVEEIKTRVETALDYNEWEWLEKHPEVRYKHKTIAEGLENILCRCPKCGAIHSLKTEKNQITCEKCDLSVTLDDRYQLTGVNFKNIAEWYEWQTAEIESEIKKNKNYSLESEVELRHLGTDGKSFTKHAGFGVCKLDRTGLLYKGTDGDKEVEKFFPIDSIYRLLFGSGEDFEIYDGQEIYYFVPKDKRSCIDWYIVSGLLKEKL